MTDDHEHERRSVEQWFRRRGLPAVVRGRPRQLLVRTLPAVVWLALSDLLQDVLELMDGTTDADFDRRLESFTFAGLYLLTLAASVVVPVVGAWLAVRLSRRWVLHGRVLVTAGLVAAGYVLIWPVAERLLGAGYSYVVDVFVNAFMVAILVLLTAVGVGSIGGWALRAVLRQLRGLGVMTSRSLPLLLLVTTYGFYTTEIWQTAGVLGRGRIWLVIGFFGVVGGVFLLSVLSSELEGITAAPEPPESAGPALTRLEYLNMILVLLFTEVLQAVVFGVLVLILFVVLGLLSVPKNVMTAWAGRPVTNGDLFGVQIPIPQELLQVSMFIAVFSALYFIVTVVTDADHRRTFFDPVIAHLRVSLEARASYLSRFANR